MAVELLSPGTESEDLGRRLREINQPPTKWQVYERILRIPYYVVYDRYENNLRAFGLVNGRYDAITLPESRLWLDEIGIGLGLWQGVYQQTSGLWLRWYDRSGWLPTPSEQAKAESERADKLAAYLRSQGVDPDNLPV